MNILGLSTEDRNANLGRYGTPLLPSPVISGILTPKDWKFEPTAGASDVVKIAAFETAVSAMLLHIDQEQRGQYVGPFEQFDDKGESTQYQTMGYGGKFKTRDATITKEYTFVNQGLDYWTKVLTYKGKHRKYKWLEIDTEGVVYGTNYYSTTTGLVTGIKGYTLNDLSPQNRKQTTGGAVELHVLSLSFQKSSEANEELSVIATGKDYDGVVSGLVVNDVTITANGAMVAKVVSTSVVSCGMNLCLEYPGLCVVGNFLFRNKQSGSTTFTSTTAAIVDGNLVFTFSGSGAGWNAGDDVEIYLKDVATLSGSGFKYFESTTPICTVEMVA